jgi:hypothetical protein
VRNVPPSFRTLQASAVYALPYSTGGNFAGGFFHVSRMVFIENHSLA